MDELIKKRIDEWTRSPFDEDSIREITELVDKNNQAELTERFYRTLEFGTGGLRGIISAGSNRMNIYTVGMATQGLANYMMKTGSHGTGAVIARDSRNKSDIFAREAASIIAGNGIPVFYFDDIMPTPLASFAIRELGAQAGIVITASHNPPEYNGYKVYWDDGGQIVSPHDKLIIKEVEAVTSPVLVRKMNFDEAIRTGMIRIIGDDVISAYIRSLEKVIPLHQEKKDIHIVYTPLHGTGYRIVPRILEHFGFLKVTVVSEQVKPDGSFPTVKSPNPEERDAMKMALELASRTNADIVLATDPDADRMGVGFRNIHGTYDLITGNQIGSMLCSFVLTRAKESGMNLSDGLVIKTIVTTELQREIAEKFGCVVQDVLTGFKWIASSMKEHEENSDRRFLFGGEESYGYLPVSFVRDKDAVSSILFFAEMTAWLREKGLSLSDYLDSIYLSNSLHRDDLLSLTLKGKDGQERIGRIMKFFRTDPPAELAGTPVLEIRDIGKLVSLNLPSGITTPIAGLPSSDVIQMVLADGSRVTLRPSGTEPKIKFYFNARIHADKDSLELKKQELEIIIQKLGNDLLKKIEKIQ